MGCFLACFGLPNKRKRRKTLYNVIGGHQKYGKYQVLAITEKSIVPYSDFRDKDGSKEKNSVKIKKKKKKVTFNLNVEIFEPNPSAYQALDNEEEENEKNIAEAEEEGSEALTMRYPSNYRYYNCMDGYDEVDEIVCEEYEIEDYDDNDDDEYSSDESLESDKAEVSDSNTEQKKLSQLKDENDIELKYNYSGRDRSINMHSVLIPVENLTQWREIKAKVTSSKNMRKENVQPLEANTSMLLGSESSFSFSPCSLESNVLQSKSLLKEIAVDSSLSNWLVSPNYDVSKATIHCQ
ncbi:hypothetical protein Lal_00021571 [Lupinus albus]|uniref:Uncharacterized protein n=1 Tax=Lupinus albus TaxID=3870 RepID=A0A6A5LKC2_LUPAL|nr:hypothetical protein Lalb_Chr21g0312461 [Lupinus albus]KAF1860528.1 hypothetical protein Lal_00021571 [Lupinus albus]